MKIGTSEAAKLTRSGVSTIKRWARKTLAQEREAARFIFIENIPSGHQYMFDKDYLISHFSKKLPQKKVTEIINRDSSQLEGLNKKISDIEKLLEQKDKLIDQQNLLIQSLISKLD